MPSLTVNSRQVSYETVGDGFPLLLLPDACGRGGDWEAAMPLLGELCRVIAYAYPQAPFAPLPEPSESASCSSTAGSSGEAVMDLAALCDALGLERAYLAGYASGGQTALHFALRHPNRLEGLVLVAPDKPWLLLSQEAVAAETRHAIDPSPVPGTPRSVLTMPTLLVAGEQSPTQVAWARRFAAQLSRGALGVVARAGDAPHREYPLQVGHEMLRFLLQCERQRNLVRGASFLL